VKKVLFITDASMAIATGGGRTRVIAAARQCRRLGRDIEILSFVPPHRFLTRFRVLRQGRQAFAAEAEARVYYVPRLPLRRFALISALDRLVAGAVTAIRARISGAEILHSHGLRASRFALMARSLSPRLAVVSDIHGACPEEYMEENGLTEPDPRALKLMRDEVDVLRRSDRLVFVSRAMRSHYSEKCDRDLEIEPVIPCAVDVSCQADVSRRDEMRRQNGLEKRIVFCYAGSAESYQLPDTMTEAFARIVEKLPEAYFMVLSHHEQAFRSSFARAGVAPENFSVRGTSRSGVLEALPMADVGFMLRQDSMVNFVASPTKFGEYCHCGVPVATTRFVGDVAAWIEQYRIGCLVDLEIESLVESLVGFARQVMLDREEISSRCVAFVRDAMSWDGFGADLQRAYDSLESRLPATELRASEVESSAAN
jgi:glycosyltransferase involved in cell wall biosynthesis